MRCEELWCQGYSEPNAGSDLANVQTRAELVGGTSGSSPGRRSGRRWRRAPIGASRSAAPIRAAPKHKGLSYLLVPMRQKGIEVRPISQMNGGSEFSEVFFDGARTDAEGNVVGEINGGWRVAMGTLAFERGASTLGQQFGFENELDQIIAIAKANGAAQDPILRDRLARARIGLTVMRLNALRTLSLMQDGELRREAMIAKIYWATWHRELGKLAMDVLGAASEIGEIGALRSHVAAAHVPLLARRHHLRRVQPDPAQHHRRAGPRLAPRAALGQRWRMSVTPPPYVKGHQLLEGKVVIVTAAAGTGIGYATAKRCAEEGATVVISDIHQRRLGEAAERLEVVMGRRPLAVLCNVTVEAEVEQLFAADVDRARHGRRAHQQRRSRRNGRRSST